MSISQFLSIWIATACVLWIYRSRSQADAPAPRRRLMGAIKRLCVLICAVAAFHIAVLFWGVSLKLMANALQLSEVWRAGLMWLLLPLVGLMGLVGFYLFSPWIVSAWMNCERNDRFDLALQVEQAFARAGLSAPRAYLIASRQAGKYNAFVTGLAGGAGFFKPALFVTGNLADALSSEELSAVLMHEVAHVKLHHLSKRLALGVASTLSVLAGTVLIMAFGLAFLPNALLPVQLFLSLGGCVVLQLHVVKKQITNQELEADLHAVMALGADASALASAMRKLSRLNGVELGLGAAGASKAPQVSGAVARERGPVRVRRKGLLGRFILAPAHPPAEERIERLVAAGAQARKSA